MDQEKSFYEIIAEQNSKRFMDKSYCQITNNSSLR